MLGPLAVLLAAPATTAVLTDFDGTLSPIVADPEEARPLPGATAVLARLARHFAAVAVVSGRPVSFLAQRLAAAGPARPALRRLRPGMDGGRSGPGGPRGRALAGPVAAVVEAAEAQAPPGVGVEAKGVALALHWRQAPEAGDWAGTSPPTGPAGPAWSSNRAAWPSICGRR